MASNNRPDRKYILDHMPYDVFNELCRILDGSRDWEVLGGKYMDYNLYQLDEFRRSIDGPSRAMLTHWGYKVGSIDRLFAFLYLMGHNRAIRSILPYVSSSLQERYNGDSQSTTFFVGHSTAPPTYSEPQSSEFHIPQPQRVSHKPAASSPSRYDGSSRPMVNKQPNKKEPEEGGITKFNVGCRSPRLDSTRHLSSHSFQPKQKGKSETTFSQPIKEECVTAFGNISSDSIYKEKERIKKEMTNQHAANKESKFAENFSRRPSDPMGSRKQTDLSYSRKSPDPNEYRRPSDPEYRRLSDPEYRRPSDPDSRRPSDPFSSVQSTSSLPQIRFEEIQHSTNNFSNDVLGKGGFGVVYSGTWKNTPVAIKYIAKKHNPCIATGDAKLLQSLVEIGALDSFRHKNIVSLYAYSLNEDGLCLIYQLMPNGSLEDRLRCRDNTDPLTWLQRLRIAEGTACGIQYLHTLHTDQPFIHGDIKSANILLDETLLPKLGDFGLMREGPPNEKTHTYVKYIHGTRAYLPIEYLQYNKLSTKVDTYGFGVVLFETATGLPAYDEFRGGEKRSLALYLKYFQQSKLTQLIDRKAGDEQSDLFHRFISIGLRCTENNKFDRPEMPDVFKELKNLLDVEELKMRDLRIERLSPIHHMNISAASYQSYRDNHPLFPTYHNNQNSTNIEDLNTEQLLQIPSLANRFQQPSSVECADRRPAEQPKTDCQALRSACESQRGDIAEIPQLKANEPSKQSDCLPRVTELGLK